MYDLPAVRTLAARELTSLTDTAAGLAPAEWELPTRCGDWLVRDVCSHAGLAAHQQAEAFRRATQGNLEPPAYPGAPQMTTPEIVDLLRTGVTALDDALAGLDPPTLEGVTPMPFGVVPTVVATQIPVYEYAFHGDDVRAAVGAIKEFPADIAAGFIGFLPGLVGMFAAAAAAGTPTHVYRLVAPSGTLTLAFGADGWASVDDAPADSLCVVSGSDEAIALFAMGRASIDDDRLSVTGAGASAAGEFKRWFPGP